jgi:hypothetical protein
MRPAGEAICSAPESKRWMLVPGRLRLCAEGGTCCCCICCCCCCICGLNCCCCICCCSLIWRKFSLVESQIAPVLLYSSL